MGTIPEKETVMVKKNMRMKKFFISMKTSIKSRTIKARPLNPLAKVNIRIHVKKSVTAKVLFNTIKMFSSKKINDIFMFSNIISTIKLEIYRKTFNKFINKKIEIKMWPTC